jgi:putative transposase
MATYWTFWCKAEETRAAKKFYRKLLKGLRYVPRTIITDKLRSDSAARVDVMPSVEHVQQKDQNHRADILISQPG